jgi:hypothetical protein
MASNNPLNSSVGTRDDVVAQTAALLGGAGEQLTTIVQQLQQLQTINQAQVETLQNNIAAAQQKPASDGGSTASTIGNAIQDVLGFGFGLSPLISGLVSLFGGGGSSEPPPPLTPFVLPAAVQATAGISEANPGTAFAVDSSQGGTPRAVTGPAPQITVQVQAMDSQSFLDHSNEIALAVRQAMLESSVLNDVIREV